MGGACRHRPAEEAPLESVRQAAHRYLDAWLDQMGELFELPVAPPLMELSALFTQTRGELLGPGLESLAKQLHAH